jgi:hypothetical protein
MPTCYGAPRGKRTSRHYKVKERDQIKTVLAMTVDLSMACMTKIQFIFQNRQVLTRKKLFVLLLMQLQVSDVFVFNSYSSILLLELGRMRNGVLYPMDPYAQPVQFQSKCWESADGQDTFWFRHQFRNADFMLHDISSTHGVSFPLR